MRMVAENYEQTHTHTHTRDNYSNPHCARARRGLMRGHPHCTAECVITDCTNTYCTVLYIYIYHTNVTAAGVAGSAKVGGQG